MTTALILFALFRPSSSAPLTSPSKQIWRREIHSDVDGSDVRTMQDIVWSCVATIFACSWVALHPNLPDPHISGWSRFTKRTRVVILAVLAPEFILIWALRQRIGAGSIMKKYNRYVLKTNRGPKSLILRMKEWFHVQPSSNDGPVWTLTHGFYVQMGGFLLYNKETPLRVLHFDELLKLIQSGLVDCPNVTEEDVRDRSKGDFLTKLLVVAQTTWFIVQCAARWATRLPVTELEVMTLAFAVLNIITYWLWWDKPQNVSIGVRVQLKGEETYQQGLGASGRDNPDKNNLIRHPNSAKGSGKQDTDTLFRMKEMDVTDADGRESLQDMDMVATWPSVEGMNIIDFSRLGADISAWPLGRDGKDITDSGGRFRVFDDDFNPIVTEITLEEPDITGTDGLFLRPCPIVDQVQASPSSQEDEDHDSQSNSPHPCPRYTIWMKASTFFIKCMRVLSRELYRQLRQVVVGSAESWLIEPRDMISGKGISLKPDTLNIGTFYACDIREGQYIMTLTSAVACGTLFGGLHLIPWRFVFPTYSESLLWRIAALFITLSPIILSLPMLLFTLPLSGGRGRLALYRMIPMLQPIIMSVPFYILARIAIVVLAFTTLRALPPDAYKEISWSSFIPHI